MSTEDTDLKYAMKAFAEASLALRDVAWLNDSKLHQSQEAAPKKESTISDADIETLINQEAAKYTASGIDSSEIDAIRKDLQSYIGASKMQISEMKGRAAAAFQSVAADAREKKEGLQDSTAEYNKRIEAAFNFLRDEGYITEEQEKKHKELLAIRDSYAKDSPERKAADKELAEFEKDTFQNAKEEAINDGNEAAAAVADDGLEAARANLKNIEKNNQYTALDTQSPKALNAKLSEEKKLDKKAVLNEEPQPESLTAALEALDAGMLASLSEVKMDTAQETKTNGKNAESLTGSVSLLDPAAIESLKQIAQIQPSDAEALATLANEEVQMPQVMNLSGEIAKGRA